jgi:hypothetical protein
LVQAGTHACQQRDELGVERVFIGIPGVARNCVAGDRECALRPVD